MPHSLVLNLLPQSPIPPGYLTGKHLHALFLNLVSSVDRDLGDRLHANTANKSFTLSPLQIAQDRKRDRHNPLLQWQHNRSIAPGTPCWWRVSLLDEALFGALNSLWLNLNPQHPWHLGPADLQITSILGTPQSTQHWANCCNYDQLYGQASQQERKITLHFCTPTAFRQGGHDSALPTRELIFGSLLRRWNHYSPRPFSEVCLQVLYPSSFDLRTAVVVDPRQQFAHTGAAAHPCNQFIGCVGKLTFQILGKVEAQTIQQINTLADFALYAGVGRKTTMGMGMVRRLHSSKT